MILISFPTCNHNIHEVDSLVLIYKEKFNALLDYNEGNKLSIYDEKFYIDKAPELLQPIVRYYYNQDRYKLNRYFTLTFNDYLALLNYIYDAYFFSGSKDLFIHLKNLIEYNSLLRKSFDKIYNLYLKYDDFKQNIDSIERKLYDFEIKCNDLGIKKTKFINSPKTSPNLSSSTSSFGSPISSLISSMSSSLNNFTLN